MMPFGTLRVLSRLGGISENEPDTRALNVPRRRKEETWPLDCGVAYVGVRDQFATVKPRNFAADARGLFGWLLIFSRCCSTAPLGLAEQTSDSWSQ